MNTLDFTQSRCPIPLVQTKLYLKTAKVGEIFCLKLSDSGSVSDVPKLLKKLGHKIEKLETNDKINHTFIVSLSNEESL